MNRRHVPDTPPVRRGFLIVLSVLCLAALIVYGVPYVAQRTAYAWESGRARADSKTLAKLDEAGIVDRTSLLFRMATTAVSPAVVNVQSFHAPGATADPGQFRWRPQPHDARASRTPNSGRA